MHLYKTRDWATALRPQTENMPDRVEVSADADGLAVRLSYLTASVDGAVFYPYFEETKTWDELRQTKDFSDYAWMGRLYRFSSRGVSSLNNGVGALANMYAHTKATRSGVYNFLAEQQRGLIHSLIVPFEDSPWTDWVMTVNLKEGATLLADVEVKTEELTRDVAGMHLPVIAFEEPVREGNRLTLTTQVLDGRTGAPAQTGSQVFFETTAGVLLVTRSPIRNGKAMTVLDLQGVPEGLPLKVKAGFKHYPGVHEIAITS